MKRLVLVPLALMALEVCAYEEQNYAKRNLYAESTPAYTPPKPGQPTSSSYQSTPPAPIQNAPQPNYTPSASAPSYSNSQHPYGPPGAPARNFQRPASAQPQPRTLPSHPYGPPGSGHALADATRENSQPSDKNPDNSNSTHDDRAETPYEKPDESLTGYTAAADKPPVADESKPAAAGELKSESFNSKDQHKTESDKALNKKIRDEINGGFEDSFPGIVLITSDGVVVIEGTVLSIESHDKLEKSISKVEGVKSVTNNTTVKSYK